MKLNENIEALRKDLREKPLRERKKLYRELSFYVQLQNGDTSEWRRAEIEKLMAKRYTTGAEIAILADKDTKPVAYAKHQAYRAECKATVDADIVRLKAEVEV